METLTDISSNDVCASVRIRMPVQLRASQLVEENFFLPFINGIYDNIETTHEKVHVMLKKKKKIDKELKEDGIDQKNDLGESKRIKKPSYKVIANS